ncbi:uncharacterized protein FYW47_000157 [Aplochiton taeniatus]
MEQVAEMRKQVLELQQQNEALQLEKQIMEKTFTAEVVKLQEQVSTMVQANLKLSEELKQYRSIEISQQKVKQLVKTLEEQHRTLLQTQLATLSMQLLPHTAAECIKGHMEAVELCVNLDDKESEDTNIVEVQSFPSALEDADGGKDQELVVHELIVKPTTATKEVKTQDLSRKHSLQHEQMEGQIKLPRIC